MRNLLLTTLLIPSLGFCDDWPQWRGPNRDGISKETGLIRSVPQGGPPLTWKATGVGTGYSSVSVAGGKVFTMGDVGDSSVVLALEEKSGKILWTTPVGAPAGHNNYPGTRATPTVDGDALYALNQHGDLVCVEIASGKERWRKNLQRDFGGRMMSGWRYSESPLVDGDKVLATPGGSQGAVVALNKKTGATLWQSKELTDAAGYSSIVAATIGGVAQFVQLTGNSVAGLAPATGKVLWRADRAGKTAVIPTPIVRDDLVFVTSGYGVGCNLFKVTKDSAGFKAEQTYANTSMVNHHGGVVHLGGYVYGSSDSGRQGGFTCVDFNTGVSKWSEPSVTKGAVTSADGMLIHRAERSGAVTLFEASPVAFKLLGRFEQPDRSRAAAWPHPVVANGRLYLRDMDVLLCYDVKKK